jgi:hypothetical protein
MAITYDRHNMSIVQATGQCIDELFGFKNTTLECSLLGCQ